MTREPSRHVDGGSEAARGKSDDGWEVLEEQTEQTAIIVQVADAEVGRTSEEATSGSALGDEGEDGWEEVRSES